MSTFGSGSAPSQKTVNLDALFSLSLAAYKKKLTDNIGQTNAFYYEVMKKKLYDSDTGTHLEVPLLYALTEADSYSGYDELPMTTVDGITNAIFEWAQCAVPITYNGKELKQNKKKLLSLTDAKQKQADMGMVEYFSRAFMWGAAADGGSLGSPRVSPANGSLSIDPIAKLIAYDPTASTSVGNINQGTYTWWRNITKAFGNTTTYDAFIQQFMNFDNTLSLGTGGKPDIYLVDQISFELLSFALYQRFRETGTKTDANYPFQNIMWGNAKIVLEDKTPDAYTGVNNSTTYGSIYGINTEFMKVTYEAESDFELLRDENGNAFQKPANQDARVAHLAWMGATNVSNRRKIGVFGKIPRTLTIT